MWPDNLSLGTMGAVSGSPTVLGPCPMEDATFLLTDCFSTDTVCAFDTQFIGQEGWTLGRVLAPAQPLFWTVLSLYPKGHVQFRGAEEQKIGKGPSFSPPPPRSITICILRSSYPTTNSCPWPMLLGDAGVVPASSGSKMSEPFSTSTTSSFLCS